MLDVWLMNVMDDDELIMVDQGNGG